MTSDSPTVTVVTIVRNEADVIERTLSSVIGQDYPLLEYLVLDGGSTDGTVDVIRRHAAHIAQWTSVPDGGPYAAMNRGAEMASGEWIVFMNGGDVFASSDAISKVFASRAWQDSDVLYGDGIITGPTFRVVEAAVVPLTLTDGNGFSHQSAFVRTSLQKAYRFDICEHIAADYDLFLRLFRDGKRFRHVDVVVSEFFMGGLSSIGRPQTIRLRHRLYRRYFPRSDFILFARLVAYHGKVALRGLIPTRVWTGLKRRLGRNTALSLEER